MSHRPARIANVIRDVVSDAIANRVSDPRINRFTSVTRVELSSDLQAAVVLVSVMGTETQANTTMKGLQSARGMIQTLIAKRLDIRQCPIIRFHLDKGIKTALSTFREINKTSAEDLPAAASPSPGDNESTSGVGS